MSQYHIYMHDFICPCDIWNHNERSQVFVVLTQSQLVQHGFNSWLQFLANNKIFFMAKNFVHMYTIFILYPSSVVEHLHWLHRLAIVNRAVINTYYFLCVMVTFSSLC